MSKFERIVREPLVMGGQARIRDTGITVNEIVRLSLDGSSQAEILQKFPQLEAEDVHEALGYSIIHLKNSAIGYIHNVRNAVDSIRTFADLLVEPPQPLEDQQKAMFLGFIQKHARWHDYNMAMLNHNVRSSYSEYKNQNQVLDIAELKQVLENLPHFCKSIGLLEFILENELSETTILSSPKTLTLILAFLMRGNVREVHATKPRVKMSLSEVVAIFTILTMNVEYITTLDSIRIGDDLISIANLWIYELGSELKIRQEENMVIFEFALPIVDAPG
jgi:uncharacterized protein (DUF433 family)